MARPKRGFRWALFLVAAICFFYTILRGVSILGVGLFFVCGGAWYWLEQRKTRELDALPPGERHVKDDE